MMNIRVSSPISQLERPLSIASRAFFNSHSRLTYLHPHYPRDLSTHCIKRASQLRDRSGRPSYLPCASLAASTLPKKLLRAPVPGRHQYSSSAMPKSKERKVAPPRPSASVLLISPTNQVLLLHRVQTSSSFPSAHVFPGGNISAFHDGEVAGSGTAAQHRDSLAYRLGAVRETFEESGILLARKAGSGGDGELLNLSSDERHRARKLVHANEARFTEWLKGVGGVADTGALVPFTRWITPPNVPKRFTTQMYLYMLPLSASLSSEETLASTTSPLSNASSEALIPTADGGVEHTAAKFDDVASWLEKQDQGDIILFPPQLFLLTLLSKFLTGPPPLSSTSLVNAGSTIHHYQTQRTKLLDFLREVPTAQSPKAASHPTSQIPWSEKIISPNTLLIRHSDQRVVLALDKPGKELAGSGKGGDWERVVLLRFTNQGPLDVEVRGREEVLLEEREYAESKDQESANEKTVKGNAKL